MPQTCRICRHEKRNEIEQAILGGEAFRRIAKRFGTSATALFRHRKAHIPATLAKAKEVAEEVRAETLLDRLREINRETAEILKDARASGTHAVALQAIARAEKQLELEARLLGQLSDGARVALGVSVSPVTLVFGCRRPPWAPELPPVADAPCEER